MFSARFKNKYDLNYAETKEESVLSADVVEAQRVFLRHLIDETEVPPRVEQKVFGTAIELSVLRDAVR